MTHQAPATPEPASTSASTYRPLREPLPLRGRTALVTGASRRTGIGYAVARRLAAFGASVYLHHHTPHDAAQPWGADPDGPVSLAAGVRGVAPAGARVVHGPADLTEPDAPARLIEAAAEALGGSLDILVANHALSGSDGPLEEVDAAMLDAHWAVNTRSTVLLTQAFAARKRAGDAPDRRVVFMVSGQDVRGGMPEEIAYGLAKGALASSVRTLATALAPQRITVNAVNPGPVDTGYRQGEDYAAVAALFPGGRWATAEEAASLVSWLTTGEASWITGEVINAEGGFAR